MAALTRGQPAGGGPPVIGVTSRGPYHVLFHHYFKVEDEHDDSPILILHGYHVHQTQEAAPCRVGRAWAMVIPHLLLQVGRTQKGPSTSTAPQLPTRAVPDPAPGCARLHFFPHSVCSPHCPSHQLSFPASPLFTSLSISLWPFLPPRFHLYICIPIFSMLPVLFPPSRATPHALVQDRLLQP